MNRGKATPALTFPIRRFVFPAKEGRAWSGSGERERESAETRERSDYTINRISADHARARELRIK